MRSIGADDPRTGRLGWALVFVFGGIAILLFNLGAFAAYEPFLQYGFSALMGIAGIAFFISYLSNRSHWWRLIPGWTLVALAGMVYLTTIETLDQRITSSLLFVGQALAFGHIFLLDRPNRWWAVIPGGFMLVLGGAIALSSQVTDPDILGTFLFVGMGIVFLLLYPVGGQRQLWWALIPGSVLVVFGLFLFSVDRSEQNNFIRFWPVLLILLGIFMGWLAYRRPVAHKLAVNSAPNLSRHSTAKRTGKEPPPQAARGHLGEYHGPAPGASVEVISDPDEE